MHLTGDYVAHGSEFSSSKWLPTTEFYLDKIKHDLTGDNWTGIFQALRHLRESDARKNKIQVGAPSSPKPREALLPDDPPSPVSLD